MTDEELEKWIEGCADYLKEKISRDDEFERRVVREGEALPLRTETKSRLEDALQKAEALQKSLYPLALQARDNPFPGMERQINKAYDAATDAFVACTLALSDSLPSPGDRRLQYRYHRSAVKLAAAFFSEPKRKQTLEVAHQIIQAAALDDGYSTEAAHKWWADYRKADEKGK
tara:strand:- start:2003 stop:2521 length:519 start_codon:yes stop_codon:yes gene_type:complete